MEVPFLAGVIVFLAIIAIAVAGGVVVNHFTKPKWPDKIHIKTAVDEFDPPQPAPSRLRPMDEVDRKLAARRDEARITRFGGSTSASADCPDWARPHSVSSSD